MDKKELLFELTSKNVAQICLEMNFDSIEKEALNVLSDTIYQYIEEIGEAAKDITELSGRRETNLMDMLNTLKDYDINKHMIIQHTKTNKINFKFFHQDQIPEGEERIVKAGKEIPISLSSKEVPTCAGDCSNIPPFMRKFPPPIFFKGSQIQEAEPSQRAKMTDLLRTKRDIEADLEKQSQFEIMNQDRVENVGTNGTKEQSNRPTDLGKNIIEDHEMNNPFLLSANVVEDPQISVTSLENKHRLNDPWNIFS